MSNDNNYIYDLFLPPYTKVEPSTGVDVFVRMEDTNICQVAGWNCRLTYLQPFGIVCLPNAES